jgi:hypothetical protein
MLGKLCRFNRRQRVSHGAVLEAAARRACEPLESRLLFTTFTVTGTAAADTISLSVGAGFVIANVNGNISSQPDAVVTDVVINALGSDDTIIIHSNSNNPVTVNGGTENDTLQITPNTQDLSNITDDVTFNGEAGTDTLSISDQALATGANYHFSNGNQFHRDNVTSTFTYNTAESVEVSEGTATFHLTDIDTPSTSDITVHGGASNSRLEWLGNGSGNLVLTPSGTTVRSGRLQFAGGKAIIFDQQAFVEARSVNLVQLITPNSDDSVALGSITTTKNKVTGTSGGIGMSELDLQDVGALELSVGIHDGATSTDTISVTGTMGGINNKVDILAGTGTNTMTVSGGPWTIDTGFGVDLGNNLDVIDNGSAITFDGVQSLNRLEINNGGTVDFASASGTELSTHELAVTSGTGTLDTGVLIVSCPGGGTFSIGAGCTLIKKGAGQLGIAAAQSHGAGSTMTVQAGVLNFTTDAGSASARNLNLISSGTTNLTASQHLASVESDGAINMTNNGNRVLVTGAAFTGSESGVINLGDNDMILDYTGATPFNAIKLMLRIGRDHGVWDGLGINSLAAHNSAQHNTTLGLLEATEFKSIYGNSATFAGQTIDTTALLVKFTYYGDADFNGKVNFDDYVRTDTGFNNHRTGWLNGDFDFNDAVNFDDYVLIDNGFNTQGAALRRGAAAGSRLIDSLVA